MPSLRKAQLATYGTGVIQPLFANWFKQPDEDLRRYSIQGKRASSNEYWVGLALDELVLGYIFQLSIMGGRSVAFGMVLDFMVETVPIPTPLWVQGDYWHQGAQRQTDLRQQAVVEAYGAGQINQPVEIWGNESDTYEKALRAVRKYFRT
jgi:hypothetical protein